MLRCLHECDGIKEPQADPEMLAYLVCILHTSQDFGGLAWVNLIMIRPSAAKPPLQGTASGRMSTRHCIQYALRESQDLVSAVTSASASTTTRGNAQWLLMLTQMLAAY